MKYIFILVSLSLSSHLYGQQSTYIGFDVNVSHDIYAFMDEEKLLIPSPIISGSGGMIFRQELHKNISIETGLIYKLYSKGFGISGLPNSRFSFNAINTWQIPVRFKTKVNITKDIFSISPSIGYIFCINNSYYSGAGSGSRRSLGHLTIYSRNETSDYSLTRIFPLLETSIGFEFRVFKHSILTISPTYFIGFTKIIQLDIEYQKLGSSTNLATAFTKGQNLSLGLGLRFPIWLL
ncbi:MAG: hypothetical protein ABJB16_04165 [Saprospiraceae bacterium]